MPNKVFASFPKFLFNCTFPDNPGPYPRPSHSCRCRISFGNRNFSSTILRQKIAKRHQGRQATGRKKHPVERRSLRTGLCGCQRSLGSGLVLDVKRVERCGHEPDPNVSQSSEVGSNPAT